jgi:acetyltransferase
LIPGLARLFQSVVNSGASLNFLAPLSLDRSLAYWDATFDEVDSGLRLYVFGADGEVLGTAQLAPCMKENGRHRGEVQKVMVHPNARARGIARSILTELETDAVHLGITTLVLDTEAGSDAESVYRRLGWIKAGNIPNFALSATGHMIATTYFYKLL